MLHMKSGFVSDHREKGIMCRQVNKRCARRRAIDLKKPHFPLLIHQEIKAKELEAFISVCLATDLELLNVCEMGKAVIGEKTCDLKLVGITFGSLD
jgi:hypothetical protein